MGMFKPCGTWWNPPSTEVFRNQCDYIEFRRGNQIFDDSVLQWYGDEEGEIICYYVYDSDLKQQQLIICDTNEEESSQFILNPNSKGFFVNYSGGTNPPSSDIENFFVNVTKVENLSFLNWSLVNDISLAFFGMQSLQNVNLDSDNQTNIEQFINIQGMFNGCTSLETITFPSTLKNVNNMSHLFQGCENLINIENMNWDWSVLTDFTNTFAWCKYLDIDLKNFNLPSNTPIKCENMFYRCQQLIKEHLPIMSNIKPTSIQGMFADCHHLKYIPNIDTWDVSEVTSLKETFFRCRSLETLDLTSWNTSEVTNFTSCFALCKNIKTITFGEGWNMQKAEDIISFFEGCSLDIFYQGDNFILSELPPQVESLDYLFAGTTTQKPSFDLAWDTTNITSMVSTFANSQFIPTNLGQWDVSNVEDMPYMFADSPSETLKTLDLSNWNVDKVSNFEGMFSNLRRGVPKRLFAISKDGNPIQLDNIFAYNDLSLSHLNLSTWKRPILSLKHAFANTRALPQGLANWDVSQCVDLRYIFANCENLSPVDISSWNTENVQWFMGMFSNNTSYPKGVGTMALNHALDMSYMFNGCSNLATLNLSQWDMSNVTAVAGMFAGCSDLPLGLKEWDVSKIEDFTYMFANTTLNTHFTDLTTWRTESAKHFEGMFAESLFKTINLKGWMTKTVLNFNTMFTNCPNLTHIYGLEDWDTSAGKTFSDIFALCPRLQELNLSSWTTTQVKYGEEFVAGYEYNISESSVEHGDTPLPWTMESIGLSNFFGQDENVSLQRIKVGKNFSFQGHPENTAEGMCTLPKTVKYWYDIHKNPYSTDQAITGQQSTTYFKKLSQLDVDIFITRKQISLIAETVRLKQKLTKWFSIEELIQSI